MGTVGPWFSYIKRYQLPAIYLRNLEQYMCLEQTRAFVHILNIDICLNIISILWAPITDIGNVFSNDYPDDYPSGQI